MPSEQGAGPRGARETIPVIVVLLWAESNEDEPMHSGQ